MTLEERLLDGAFRSALAAMQAAAQFRADDAAVLSIIESAIDELAIDHDGFLSLIQQRRLDPQ